MSEPESSPTIISTDPTEYELPLYHADAFVSTWKNNVNSSDNWDKYYPYQLLLVRVLHDGSYAPIPLWKYTLPIPPESMSITLISADRVEATLNGYTEKLGGAPFREISFSGTTGVNIGKGSVGGTPSPGGSFGRPFVDQARSIAGGVATVFGGPVRVKNELPVSGTGSEDLTSGFLLFHGLRTFLEGYIAIKQSAAIPEKDDFGNSTNGTLTGLNPKDIRLAFCNWKDSSIYLCTLKNFDMKRSANSPMEYMYSLNLRAFRRIALNAAAGSVSLIERNDNVSPNIVNDVLNRIQAARQVIIASKKLLNTALLGPLAIVSEVSRQVTGAAKDIAGVARDIVEMPASFARGVLNEMKAASSATNLAANTVAQNYKKLYDDLATDFSNADFSLTFGLANPTRDLAYNINKIANELASNLNNQLKLAETNDPSAPDPRDFQAFGAITAEEAAAAPALRQQLDTEVATGRKMTADDLRLYRAQVQEAQDQFAALIGAWATDYQELFDLPIPTSTQRAPAQEEFDALAAMNEIILATDKFTVYLQERGNQIEQVPSSLEYVAGLAEASGIAFTVPSSKFAVPFPYGATLEGLALTYLGNANRWHEIATMNGLRAPYVDEVGVSLFMQSNGDSNTVAVNDVTNLFLKQTVYLSSDSQNKEARHVIDIAEISPTNFLVTLDGAKDLDRFTTAENAKVDAFLPGTVNSRKTIYIPSQGLPDDPSDIEAIPGVDVFDPLLKVAGVDWLLDDKLGLVVTETGDNPLSYGLRNIVQTLQIGFTTPRASLKQHPGFGVGVKPGTSTSDVNAKDIVASAEEFINADPTFSGLKRADISILSNKYRLNIEVGISGTNKNVPVSFPLNF